MRIKAGLVRKCGLAFVGTACLVGGLILVWMLIRPGVIEQVRTAHLTAVTGLLVLPGLTGMALLADRRANESAPARPDPQPDDPAHAYAARTVPHNADRARSPRRHKAHAYNPIRAPMALSLSESSSEGSDS